MWRRGFARYRCCTWRFPRCRRSRASAGRPLKPLAGLVGAPDVAEGVADLADGGPGPQRLLHRVEDVGGAAGGILQVLEVAVDRGLIAVGAEFGEAFALVSLDGRVDPQRLVALLRVDGVAVHAHHHALAGVD